MIGHVALYGLLTEQKAEPMKKSPKGVPSCGAAYLFILPFRFAGNANCWSIAQVCHRCSFHRVVRIQHLCCCDSSTGAMRREWIIDKTETLRRALATWAIYLHHDLRG